MNVNPSIPPNPLEGGRDILEHWHPIIGSRDLKQKPVGVTVCGREIVLFRTKQGSVGALEDRCCHRGMRLSKGWVEEDRLTCPYHIWSYDTLGNVKSPGTPNLQACIECFDVVEKYQTIWVRKSNALTTFPEIDTAGYEYVCTLFHSIQAPMELVLDNFSELEHTAIVHPFLGYSREKLSEIELNFKADSLSVKVSYKGFQKKIPWLIEKLFGVNSGDYFFNQWTTYFSPVHTVYKLSWFNQKSNQYYSQKLIVPIFFTPINERETQLVTIAFATGVKKPFNLLVRPFFNYLLDQEMKQDKAIVENLADQQVSTEHMQLGRYDRVLIENRKRIDQIYRGNLA